LRWRSRYGFVGFNAFGSEVVIDGLNETGLAMSELWLPGHSSFPDASEAGAEQALGPTEFANWSLGNFATVAELKVALPGVKVWGAKTAELGNIPALIHFAFHDPSGHCLVVELVEGPVDIHDNPLGVLTNAPPLDWHINNLRNYLNLTALKVPKWSSRESSLPPPARAPVCSGCQATALRLRASCGPSASRRRPSSPTTQQARSTQLGTLLTPSTSSGEPSQSGSLAERRVTI